MHLVNPDLYITSAPLSSENYAEHCAVKEKKKSTLRSAAKKVEAQAKAGKADEAAATLKTASGLLDKAAQAGVISKNAAARKKSKLAKKVNAAK